MKLFNELNGVIMNNTIYILRQFNDFDLDYEILGYVRVAEDAVGWTKQGPQRSYVAVKELTE